MAFDSAFFYFYLNHPAGIQVLCSLQSTRKQRTFNSKTVVYKYPVFFFSNSPKRDYCSHPKEAKAD